MGLLNLLFGNSEDRKRKEMESIEDNLVHLYGYSKKDSPGCLMKKRRISGTGRKNASGNITRSHIFADK